jgi:hypothetical protein
MRGAPELSTFLHADYINYRVSGRFMPATIEWPIELAAAAKLLVQAASYASCLKCSRWQFAVDVNEFREHGVSLTDLRYLTHMRLIEHAEEISGRVSKSRRFRKIGAMTLSAHSCIVLSKSGMASAASLHPALSVRRFAELSRVNGHSIKAMNGFDLQTRENEPTVSRLLQITPIWNLRLRRLSLGRLIVKQYHLPAPNQERVLTRFHDENWIEQIADPLPRVAEINPKQRLHETIAALNRRQTNPVLRFMGDGTGRGVRWAPIVLG